MARPYPAPATIGARGISNLVPGGYAIRPYDMGGEWCARRTAPDPGGWRADVGIGPYEAEPSNFGTAASDAPPPTAAAHCASGALTLAA